MKDLISQLIQQNQKNVDNTADLIQMAMAEQERERGGLKKHTA